MLLALSLLFAAACLVPGSAKVLGHPQMRKAAAHFRIPWRGYELIGVAELAAAAGVLTGLWWHPLGARSSTLRSFSAASRGSGVLGAPGSASARGTRQACTARSRARRAAASSKA